MDKALKDVLMSATVTFLAAQRLEGHVEGRRILYQLGEAALADVVSEDDEGAQTAAVLTLNPDRTFDLGERPDPKVRELLTRATIYFHGLTFLFPEVKRSFLFLARDIAHAIATGDASALEEFFQTLQKIEDDIASVH